MSETTGTNMPENSSDLNYSSLIKICKYCRKTAKNLKWCGQCRGVTYCSQSCQAQDWAQHKEYCDPTLFETNKKFKDMIYTIFANSHFSCFIRGLLHHTIKRNYKYLKILIEEMDEERDEEGKIEGEKEKEGKIEGEGELEGKKEKEGEREKSKVKKAAGIKRGDKESQDFFLICKATNNIEKDRETRLFPGKNYCSISGVFNQNSNLYGNVLAGFDVAECKEVYEMNKEMWDSLDSVRYIVSVLHTKDEFTVAITNLDGMQNEYKFAL